MNEITTTRANHLIDPVLNVWRGEVALYLFLGGLVAGLMILAGYRMLRAPNERRSRAASLILWAAPILISAGMFFLWLDLEHPFNAYRFYLTLQPSSPMSWGAWILLLVYPASILLAWVMTPDDLKNRCRQRTLFRLGPDRIADWAAKNVRLLAVLNIAGGAALGVYTGVLLGTMAARPLWNSAILGPLFLVSGVSTGAAFLLLYKLADRERVLLSRLDMGLILTELALIALWFVGLASGGAAYRNALSVFFGGPYTAAFWTLVVMVGLFAPLTGEWLEHRHGAVPGRLTAILVLIGGFALRWIVVYAGQFTDIAEVALR
jgi:formate-dependent nitrite reductase membrane component NrfD